MSPRTVELINAVHAAYAGLDAFLGEFLGPGEHPPIEQSEAWSLGFVLLEVEVIASWLRILVGEDLAACLPEHLGGAA